MVQGKDYKPNKKHREMVVAMARVGVIQEQIAAALGFSVDTLSKYYKTEMAQALAQSNTVMGGTLFQSGINGNVAAQIFWMKTKGRWRTIEEDDRVNAIGLPSSQEREVYVADNDGQINLLEEAPAIEVEVEKA